MERWIEKIELNKVVSDVSERFDLSKHEEPCPDEAKAALANEVKKSARLSSFAHKLVAAKSIAEVNRVLEQVFDRADKFRVWCGF